MCGVSCVAFCGIRSFLGAVQREEEEREADLVSRGEGEGGLEQAGGADEAGDAFKHT